MNLCECISKFMIFPKGSLWNHFFQRTLVGEFLAMLDTTILNILR